MSTKANLDGLSDEPADGAFAATFPPIGDPVEIVFLTATGASWTPIWQGMDLNAVAVIGPAVDPGNFTIGDLTGLEEESTPPLQMTSSAGVASIPVPTAIVPGPVGSQGSLTLVAGLAATTGPVLGNNSTSDDTIAGRAIDTAAIVSLTVSIDGGAVASELGAIAAGGGFTLTPTMIAALAGGTLADGTHSVVINATDANSNSTSAGVTFTLDSVIPSLSAGLMQLTGTTTLAQSVGATTNDTVTGSGSDSAGIISLYGTLDGTADFANLTGDIGGNGAFTLTPTVLNSLAGGVVPNGHHSLVLQATDTAGNVTTRTVNFTLETVLGVPTLALASADQTTNPTTTDASAITLLGTTTPEAIVTLMNNGATATAGQTGLFQFTNVPVAAGGNSLTVQVTDLAGNTSDGSLNVTQASTGGTDPVIEWDTITNQAITTDASPPTVASRALAIESLSVYNAVAAIDGTPGFDSSLTAPSDANAQAAVIEAADTALDSLYPAQAAGFDAQAATDLAAIPNGLAKTEGIAVGQQAARAELALRANDGSANSVTDIGGETPGQWQPTAPAYAPALTPQWATLTPFALQSSGQFLPAAPPAIGTQAYADAVNETYTLGALNSTARTAAETQAALFWNLPNGTDTPAGEWNLIASTVATTNDLGLSEDALLFAELNVAEGDGAIAAWNGKFTYNAWRPITVFNDPTLASVNSAIDTPGNDPIGGATTWQPLLVTPNFPEYPEGHGVFSGAAATVLASFFGDNTTFSVPSQTLPGGVDLTFTSFSSAATDAAMSRIWGGIHFSFSATAALSVGDEIGAWTLGAFNSGADTTPPKVTLNNPTGGTTNRDPVITGVVSSSFGVAALDAMLPNGTSVNVPLNADGSFSFTVPEALDGTADGGHLVTFVAVDPAGEQSPAVNYSFTLITQAPAIAFAQDSVRSNATLGAASVLDGTIGLETGDSLQSFTYSFDGGAAMPIVVNPTTGAFDTPLDLTPLTPGQHELELTALDSAGNTATKYIPVTYALPSLTLTSITPTVGTQNVGVTFRPSITFSRAVNPSTLSSTDFYATDTSGAVLPATVVPFSDGTGAWLLPTGAWPGSSNITLHVVGQDIQAAADGAELDAADVGTPGSSLSESFSTVGSTPVPGTTITGLVVDPGPDGTPFTVDDVRSSVGNSSDYATDTWKLPIAGATVYILGDEQDAVKTAADGSFTLTNVPSGDVKVVVDGTTATNDPASYYFPAMTLDINVKAGVDNTVPADMGSPAEQSGMAGDPAIYLPRVASDALTPISSSQPTTVTAATDSDLGSGAFTMTQQQLSELSLTVQANSIVDANGNPVANPTVGIAPVPASIVQDMLPAGLMQHSFDITIQTPGASVFTTGASLTMPNVFGLAPGQQTYILSFDHTTGRLVIDGTATASADGQTVTTDPNTAIMAPGWHGMTPPGSNGNGNVGDDYPATEAAAYKQFILAEGQANPTALAIVTGGASTVDQASNGASVVLGTAGALGVSGPAIAYGNGVGTGYDAGSTISNFGSNASAVYNQPSNLAAWAVLAAQGAHDVANLALDLGGNIPGPAGQWASGLRAATGAVDFYQGMPSSNASVQSNVNTLNNSNPFGTLSPGHQLNGGFVTNDGMASAFDSIVASVDAEVAYQLPIYERIENDLSIISVFDEFNLTQPGLGVTAAQLGTIAAELPAIQSAFTDYVGAVQELAGHPTAYGLAEDIANGLATVEAADNATDFLEIRPPTFSRGIEYVAVEAPFADVAPPSIGVTTATGGIDNNTNDIIPLNPISGGGSPSGQTSDTAAVSDAGAPDQVASTTMYAAIQGSDGSVQRLSFMAGQGYSFFFAPNTYYQITVFDPTSNSIGETFLQSAPSGQNTSIPLVGLTPDPATPGADGLTPTEAFVIGVSNTIADNLVPGVTDLAALQEGLYNGSVLPGTTGVVASLALQGSAQAVALAGSLTSGLTTYAYVATGNYGLAVVDVSNPDAPVALSQISLGGNATGVAVNSALGIAVVANGTGLSFVDVSNPAAPTVIQTVPVSATVVQNIDGVAYANNGGSLDSFDLATGTLLQTLGLGGATISGIAVEGSFIYTMDSSDVLHVIDTSSGSMVIDGSVSLPFGGNQIFAADGVVYVGAESVSTAGGYLTVDVSNPSSPALIEGPDNRGIAGAALALNGSGTGISVQQGLTPQSQLVNFLSVFNTSSPNNTGQFITQYNLPARPYGVAIGDGIGFVADGGSGLQVVNYLAPDTAGVPPLVTTVVGPTDVDPSTAGIQLYEGVPISLSATVTDDVQVRNVELLVNGTVVSNAVTFPFDLTATMPSIASLGTNVVSMRVEAIDTGGNVDFSTPIVGTLVPDTRPLNLLNQSISEGAVLSQFNRTISLTFSKPLNAASVTTADFEIITQAGSVVPLQSLEVSGGNQVVSLNFGTLAVGAYKLVVNASQVTDDNGVALGAGTLVTDFTTQNFTAVFTNASGGSWNTASNWNTNAVPAATDSVFIGNAIGAAVNYDGNTDSVAQLVASGTGQFDITNGSLTVTTLLQADEPVVVTGGALSATGAVSISGQGEFQINNRSTGLNNVAIAAGGQILLPNNNFLFASGTYANAGLISLNSNNNPTELVIGGTVALSGNGAIQLSNNANNFIFSNGTAATLTNAGNTISGGGQIGDGDLALENLAGGTIDATAANNQLIIAGGQPDTNAGLLEGTGPSPLLLTSVSIANSGTIAAPTAGSFVNLQSASITGGILTTANGGVIQSIDRNSRLDDVTLSPGTDIHLLNNDGITVADTLANHGTVFLDSSNNPTSLVMSGSVTLNGGGAVQLSNNANNFIVSNGAAATLVNVDNTIAGAGTIGDGTLALTNQAGGTINANAANNPLIIQGGQPDTNAGLMESGGPQPLILRSVAITNSGTIAAPVAGSSVNLQSASITDGTLATASGGIIQAVDRNSLIDNATLSTGSDIHVTNNNALALADTVTNLGTVFLDSSNNITVLSMIGGATLTGSGTVHMSDDTQNFIQGATGAVLDNVNNTILGAGTIGDGVLTIDNEAAGTIDASAAGNALILTGLPVTNAGLIEGTGSQPMVLRSVTINNTGTIAAPLAGSSVQLQSATINGGVVMSANGGVIDAIDRNSALNGATIAGTASTLIVVNNDAISLAGTVTNQGTLALASTNNFTTLVADGNATLTGGGQVQLSDNANNFLLSNGTAASFVNVNNMISGGGRIGDSSDAFLSMVNATLGFIDASAANALAIELGGGTLTNTGTIEATSSIIGNGGLLLSASAIDQRGGDNAGVILASGTNSHVDLQSATVLGGTLTTANGGVIQAIDRNSLIDNATLSASSNIHVTNNNAAHLADTLTNLGTVYLDSSNNFTGLIFNGGATLTGSGIVQMSDDSQNFVEGTTGAVLDNVNNTIEGAGTIGDGVLTIDNDAAGTIDASAAGNALILTGLPVTNTGLIEGTGPQPMVLRSVTINNNGTIAAPLASSSVQLQSVTINGGVVMSANGGAIHAIDRGGVLNGVTIAGATSSLVIDGNQYMTLAGTVTNQGTILVASTNTDTRLVIAGTVTLTGGGDIQSTSNDSNSIQGNGTQAVLINVNNVFMVSGQLGDGGDPLLSIVNQSGGIIDASNGNALRIAMDFGTLTNAGTIESTAGNTGGLAIQSSTIDNTGSNNAGIVRASGANSHVDLQSAVILGGTLQASSGGVIQAVDRDSLLNGVTVSAGSNVNILNDQYLALTGTIDNAGTIGVDSSNNDTRLTASGAASLIGGGVIQLTDNSNNLIGGATGAVLTNVNNVIRGSGQLGDGSLSFVNQASGIVDATGSGSRLLIAGGIAVSNAGLLESTGTAGLGIIGTAIINTNGTISAPVAGSHVDLQSAKIIGGTLSTANGGFFQSVDRGSTLSGVTIATGGLVEVANDQYLALAGTLTNKGTIQLNSSSNDTELRIAPGLTLTGGGVVQLSNNSNNAITSTTTLATFTDLDNTIEGGGTLGDGNMTLSIGAAATVDANDGTGLTLNTGGNTVTNAGVMRSSASGGLNVTGSVANSGTIWADGDGLTIAGNVTGTGIERISGTATLRIGGTVAAGQTAGFDTGSTGTLRLDDSRQFNGIVSGLAVDGSNALDLSDISFINTATTTATFNNGTLTVTDGTNVANIALAGDYTGHTFVTSSDGHNGTTVIDPDPTGGAVLGAMLGRANGSIMQADLLPGSQFAAASIGPGNGGGAVMGGMVDTMTPGLLLPKPGWLTA